MPAEGGGFLTASARWLARKRLVVDPRCVSNNAVVFFAVVVVVAAPTQRHPIKSGVVPGPHVAVVILHTVHVPVVGSVAQGAWHVQRHASGLSSTVPCTQSVSIKGQVLHLGPFHGFWQAWQRQLEAQTVPPWPHSVASNKHSSQYSPPNGLLQSLHLQVSASSVPPLMQELSFGRMQVSHNGPPQNLSQLSHWQQSLLREPPCWQSGEV